MFTGIIETIGAVTGLHQDKSNLIISIQSNISGQLKIDQSVAHNGVCLTVTEVSDDTHQVTAIIETLSRTNLGQLEVGSRLNLERAMQAEARFDGHLVQGHIDQTARCIDIIDEKGSWKFWFEYTPTKLVPLVEKGSICIDGVSLTVVDAERDKFSVAIIPYTFEHTCFQYLKVDDKVNLEFDIIGKYVAQQMKAYRSSQLSG